MKDKKTADKSAKTNKKDVDLQARVDELTADLKRTRADFENYRKRIEAEKILARAAGKNSTVMQLLPVIDNIERAILHRPDELKDHKWVEGVASLDRQLHQQLDKLGIKRIKASPGQEFNPDIHEAVQFNEDSDGEKEVIVEELQAGYTMDDTVVRHAIVKVTRE